MVESSDKTWKGNGIPLQYFILEKPHEQYEKTKRENTERRTPQVSRCPIGAYLLLEISGEITPERMKGWSQSKNNTKLWM